MDYNVSGILIKLGKFGNLAGTGNVLWMTEHSARERCEKKSFFFAADS